MESHKMIYIRTDGNSEIATGHLMRCLSIAYALDKLQIPVTFIVSDDESASLLADRFPHPEAFPIVNLHTDFHHLEQELPALAKLFSSQKGGALLVDSYTVTETYLSTVSALLPTAYLDDLAAFDYPVDMVINYDVLTEPNPYHKAAHVLLGGDYTPLREQFNNTSYQVSKEVRHIFFSTGGTDPQNLTLQYLKASAEQPFTIHVLLGSMNAYRQEILDFAKACHHVIIHENVTDMSEIMQSCDLAITAGGTTLFELCAVGVPTVAYCMADNQLSGLLAFRQKHCLVYAGDVRLLSSPGDTLLQETIKTADNFSLRKQLSANMRSVIDGQGSLRIASALLHLSNQ